MKNIIKVAVLAAAMATASQSFAQQTFGHKVKQDAHQVGNKTSEIAANGAATISDKKYAGKYGPGGETVYINKYSHYYYVNKKGHKVYMKRSQLRDHKM